MRACEEYFALLWDELGRQTRNSQPGQLQVMETLSLYLNFINLFQMLLSLFGQRQEG
jgi:FtsH-binding integral membrane protein